MALFTAGQPLAAAQLNAINGYVSKTADQSVTSSITPVNDTHLSYAIPATGTYLVDCYLWGLAAGTAGDIRLGFSFPTGTMHAQSYGLDLSATADTGTAATRAALSITSGAAAFTHGLSTTTVGIWFHGILTATATGTLRLVWAQAVSDANASTLKAGSHMIIKQVA